MFIIYETVDMIRKKSILALECALLFGLLPAWLIWIQKNGGVPFFPVLFGLLGLTIFLGWRDPAFQFQPASENTPIRGLIFRLMATAGGLTGLTALLYPELLFRLPRENPALWLLILILYPILSVAPQEFIFRSYFMQRYQPLFGNGRRICAANALAFGWAHAFFLNGMAPLLSIPAGWFLARTWQESKSFKRVCLEHAVYGQIVFTCGLGWFFYHGSTQALQNLTP